MSKVRVSVCNGGDWTHWDATVTAEAVATCYALPSGASRAAYWSRVIGVAIPDGRALVWASL